MASVLSYFFVKGNIPCAKSHPKYPSPALCPHFDTEIAAWPFRNTRHTSSTFQPQTNPVLPLPALPSGAKSTTSHPVSKARNLPESSLAPPSPSPSRHPYLIHRYSLTVIYLHAWKQASSPPPATAARASRSPSALPIPHPSPPRLSHAPATGIFPKQTASYHPPA